MPHHRMNRLRGKEAARKRIRRKLRQHLRELGFHNVSRHEIRPEDESKEVVRALHRMQRRDRLKGSKRFIEQAFPQFKRFYASGEEIDPTRIRPRLELVETGSREAELFRLSSLSWSIPVSNGYGRRLRFLVWDDTAGKLMGLFALGDPVFNQRARDDFIGWGPSDRTERLVDVMDAYVLGALPPYNLLLGGKIVSCLVRSREVKDSFSKKYAHTKGSISKRAKRASLVLVTTSSALGRSAVYDRLKLENIEYFHSIGFTAGWGHFHVPNALFNEMRSYLRLIGHSYASNHAFGQGPNWKLRVSRAALGGVGLDPDLLRHGVRREVFVSRLASNAEQVLRGESRRPNYSNLLPATEIGTLGVERWAKPRAISRSDYLSWTSTRMLELLDPRKDGAASLSTFAPSTPAPPATGWAPPPRLYPPSTIPRPIVGPLRGKT
jgi:Domain of unknown function (DUF4338)